MGEKSYREMSNDELRQAKEDWCGRVNNAEGWASAYFAAQQVEQICRQGEWRGLDGFDNPCRITTYA